jgi:hypothetical protein
MIQCNNSNIELLKISYVGNRIAGERVKLSKDVLQCDELTKNLIGRYLLSGIEYHQLYKFTHSEGLEYNKVYNLASEVFGDNSTFERVVDELSYFLFQKANDKSIIGGYLFVVYFKGCFVDDKTTDAFGIFKAETKDMFIKLTSKGSDISLSSEQGFALNKMDKGCIIFNVESKDGYRVAIINKSRSKSGIKYWNDDFLGCAPVVGDFLNTQAILKAIGQYIKEQDTEQIQKAILQNKSILESRKESMDVKEMINAIAKDNEGRERIGEIYSSFTGGVGIIPDFVKTDIIALKKTRLKSILKLDNNFEIVFHGGENRIETGIDKVTGMKYIKLLYEHDS